MRSRGTSRARFLAIYDLWAESVLKWIRALGGGEADREDIAQEVFLIASRRLHAFDGSNPAAWLYRITQRQVRDFRRRAWIRRIFTKDHTDAIDALADDRACPSDMLERKQSQRVLFALLSKMNTDRRAAFVLFEIDGLSGEEIARIQGVAVNTVWKRLHVARKEFLALVARHQRGYDPSKLIPSRRRKGSGG
ncbi:MAG TPA: RNA polymerase sigma factor [Polyangia bacterium]|nr:RNA polymerase sigma factor [Polyangia bacterium]